MDRRQSSRFFEMRRVRQNLRIRSSPSRLAVSLVQGHRSHDLQIQLCYALLLRPNPPRDCASHQNHKKYRRYVVGQRDLQRKIWAFILYTYERTFVMYVMCSLDLYSFGGLFLRGGRRRRLERRGKLEGGGSITGISTDCLCQFEIRRRTRRTVPASFQANP